MGYLESPVEDFGLCYSSWKKWRGIGFSLLLLREPHLHGFVPTCLLLPVLFLHKSVLSPRKTAWRTAQLEGPLDTLWWDLWWVWSVGGIQPSYTLGPVTAHFWGLHQDPDPDINPKEKDIKKVLLGSWLRAHYDPGFKAEQVPKLGRAGQAAAGTAGLSSKHAQKAEVLPGLSHRMHC